MQRLFCVCTHRALSMHGAIMIMDFWGLLCGTIILRLNSNQLKLIMENQEIEWAQLKARIPRKLHREAKIASVILDRPIVDICIEALEKAVQEADKKLTKTFRNE